MKKENDQYIEKIQNLSTEKLETEKKYQILEEKYENERKEAQFLLD